MKTMKEYREMVKTFNRDANENYYFWIDNTPYHFRIDKIILFNKIKEKMYVKEEYMSIFVDSQIKYYLYDHYDGEELEDGTNKILNLIEKTYIYNNLQKELTSKQAFKKQLSKI